MLFIVSVLLIIAGMVMIAYAGFQLLGLVLAGLGAIAMFLVIKGIEWTLTSNHDDIIEAEGYKAKVEQEELLQKELEDAKKSEEMERLARKNRRDIVFATMQQTNELRTKYFLADESLFEEFYNTYNTRALVHSTNLIEKIKAQHFSRLDRTEYVLDFEDLKKIPCISKEYIDNAVVSVYNNDSEHIVTYENGNEKSMYKFTEAYKAKALANTISQTMRTSVSYNHILTMEDVEAMVGEIKQLGA